MRYCALEVRQHVLATGLLLALSLGYAAAILAIIGILPERLFAASVVAAATASLVMLAVFFHPWLVLGIAIDVVLLYLVLATTWAPQRS